MSTKLKASLLRMKSNFHVQRIIP
uniref:Uncharacterized protein n=1 Tax=Rhizophora mucronata TaxID=61149 RepID=A0A2P2NED9_RHIMU